MPNQKEDDFEEVFKVKSKYFYEKKIPVHIKFKAGYFRNGIILELNSDFLIFDEFREGRMIIFFIEIDRLEEYKSKEENREQHT